jgi:hypothetical protein
MLDPDDAAYPGSDEILSFGAPVGRKLGLKKLGVHIETLLPGRRTSWPHAESDEEEFAYVISGNPHVWIEQATAVNCDWVRRHPACIAIGCAGILTALRLGAQASCLHCDSR